MPWGADQMFFRRQQSNEQGAYFTPWVEVVHSGNINAITTPIQTALNLKAPLASPAFTGTISTIGDITCLNDIATTITANRSLTSQQTGDTYGASSLILQNRDNFYGSTLQNLSSTATVTDVSLQTSPSIRYMR